MASLLSSPVCLAWAETSFFTCATVSSSQPLGLPWHLNKDHPLPPAGLPSLSHVPPVGSVQGSASLGGCLSDQRGDSIESISQTVTIGYSLFLVTTGDGVVTQHITVVVAGYQPQRTQEPQACPSLSRYHTLKHKIYYRK
jgi:hypothetical protein